MSNDRRKIALCLASALDQKLMGGFFAELGHQPVSGLDDPAGVDLILMDTASARRLGPQALEIKNKAPHFLPVLVGIKADGESVPWLAAGFDDVLILPCPKEILKARVDIMLRLREQSEQISRKSEYMHRALVESSGDLIFILDRQGRYLASNDRVAHLGLQRGEELIGKTIEEVYPTEIAGLYRNQFKRALHNRETVIFEHALPGSEGKKHHIDTLYPIDMPDGETIIGGICRDITERKHGEEKLLLAKEYAENLIETANVIFVQLDQEGNVVRLNSTAEEITGYRQAELKVKNWLELLLPRERYPHVWEAVKNLIQDDVVPKQFENPILTKNGEERYIMWRNSLLKDAGEITGTISFGIDITEQKQAEEKLRANHERFHALIQSAYDAIIIADKAGKIVLWNKGAEKLFLYSQQEAMDQPVEMLIPEPYLTRHREAFQRYLATGETHMIGKTYDALGLRKNSSKFPVDISLSTWKTPEGQFFGTIIRDTTKRVKAEETRRLLETAIDHTLECIFICDHENKISYVNKAFEQITGYSAAEALGKTPGLLKSAKHNQELKTTIYSGQPWQGSMIYRKKDGNNYEVQATVSPILDADGRVSHFVSVHRDVTQEKEWERRNQQNQRLEAIGTLAGGIAHDFNNILASIMGYTELCQMGLPAASNVREYLDRVQIATKRATELVRQILSVSRQQEIERSPLIIGLIVKEALKLMRGSLPATIELKQQIPEIKETVMADPTEIHQVVMNLCTNASHAMPEGGVLSVDLGVRDIDRNFARNIPGIAPGRYLKLSVSDTGSGIAPEIQDKIFEPYFTTNKIGRGTGLGLATTHNIVTSCGGAITMYSELDKGTVFHLYFPVTSASQAETVSEKIAVGHGHGEKILFVDDDSSIADLGKKILELYGYEVTASTKPLDALEMVQQNPGVFDLVVTDMTMPGLTGEKLASLLLELRPGLPIILCTGFSEKIDADKAAGMGIGKFLNKPLRPAELAVAVRELLDQGKDGNTNK